MMIRANMVIGQEARLLEMWKDKHLQPSDPAGELQRQSVLGVSKLILMSSRTLCSGPSKAQTSSSFSGRRQLDI